MQKQTTLNYIFLLLQQQQQQQQFRAAAVDEYNARASPCRQVRDYVPCKEKKKRGGQREWVKVCRSGFPFFNLAATTASSSRIAKAIFAYIK